MTNPYFVNIKSGIYQQPLIGSFSNVILKLRKYIHQNQPPMEDDFKILKVKYFSNHLLDHTQILNLDFGDKSKVFIHFK
jgi:hypothetical protein